MTNKVHEAFEEIEASENLKRSTRLFLQAQRETHEPRQRRHFAGRTALAAVCAMFVLLIGVGGYGVINAPVAYVSIDVNPSVELALNRFDRVVSCAAYNDDGKIVLDDVNVNGKLYTDAIDIIVESDAMQPYLTKDAALTFTVAAGDTDREGKLLNGIESCSGCQGHGGQGYTADVDNISEAHNCGLSFGKYAAYLALSQYDSTVTAEDCREMSMAEIRGQIKEHENDAMHDGDGTNGHNGNGTGHGHGSGECSTGH